MSCLFLAYTMKVDSFGLFCLYKKQQQWKLLFSDRIVIELYIFIHLSIVLENINRYPSALNSMLALNKH